MPIRFLTPQVRERQCARTEHGAITEASTLRWRPGRWPTRVLYIYETGESRLLPHHRAVMGPDGSIVAVVYSGDCDDWSLEVTND